MKYDPFARLKCGWLDLAGVVSEVRDEASRRRLDWRERESGRFVADDPAGVFYLEIETLADGFRFRTAAEPACPCPEELIFSPLVFPAVPADHALFCGE